MDTDANSHLSPFSSLPEGCIANIIFFTSTKDACVAAAVSSGFRSAADSDTVWKQFLPADYEEMLAESNCPVIFSSKKELYLYLCDSGLLLDGGRMSMRLVKSSGQKCYMLCAREMGIIWVDTPIYWMWTSLPESRFAQVAQLLSVCWLDIYATFPSRFLLPNTNYAAYLVFKLSNDHYGLDVPSRASIRRVWESRADAEQNSRTTYIVLPEEADAQVTRTDGWKEIELGEFFVSEENVFDDVEIRLYEIQHLNWKKGLTVEGIEVRPKEGI